MNHTTPLGRPAPMRRRTPRRPAPLSSILALAALLATAATTAGAANLSEIFRLALENDAQYAAARQTAMAGRERLVQGRAGLMPTLSMGGNLRANYDNSTAYVGRQDYGSYSGVLSLNQPLMRLGNYKTFQQGELQAELADLQLRQAELTLRLRVARGFFEVLQAEDALATLAQQKEAFATQLAQARRSYEVGLAPITDVSEAQSRYDLTLAQEIAARNDLAVRRRALEKSIARPLPPLHRVDPAAPVQILPEAQLQSLADTAADGSLLTAVADKTRAIARIEVERQDAGHAPTIDIVASVAKNRNASFGPFGGTTTYPRSVGVEFQIPLYQGGAVTSRVREAVALLGRADAELEEARRQAALDAEQARLGVESGSALVQALEQAVKSTQQQVQATRRGFEVGVRTRVDVLNAEQQLFSAQRDLSSARYQVLLAALQLKAAAGALGDDDLQAVDRLLRPR